MILYAQINFVFYWSLCISDKPEIKLSYTMRDEFNLKNLSPVSMQNLVYRYVSLTWCTLYGLNLDIHGLIDIHNGI